MWVDVIHQAGGQINVSVNIGYCPLYDDKVICIIPISKRIDCNEVHDAVGCTINEKLIYIDVDFPIPVIVNIAQHEIGHAFGINDKNDCKGVMCRWIDPNNPRQITARDAQDYLWIRQ